MLFTFFFISENYTEALVQYQKSFNVQSNHHIAVINAAKMCRKLGRNKEAEDYIMKYVHNKNRTRK